MPGWDEKETEYRYRLREPGLFDKERAVDITNGVYMIYGRVKGSNKWKPQALRFRKESFDLARAKKWLADHPDIKGNSRPDITLQEGSAPGINAALNGVEFEDDGDSVIFKNVPFAAEGIFIAPDGMAGYRDRDELEKMVPFCNSLRIVIRHPPPGIKSATINLKDSDYPVIGWTNNAHLTELEGIARINADLAILKEDRAGNNRKPLIEQMKKAQVRELSVGYFYDPVMVAGNINGKPYDHLETDINPYHLAVLPEAGTAQCAPPLCGIGCASCSNRAADNGGDSETTGDNDMTPEEEKKAKEAAAQVAAMNLTALAGANAEVKTLIDKMNAQTAELETAKKAQAGLDAKVKKGDEALAVLEKQKVEARQARVKALKEGFGEEEFGKLFPTEEAIQAASDIELGRMEAILTLADTQAPAMDAPAPPMPGGASKGLKVPAPAQGAAGKTASPKPGENAEESGRLPNVFKPLAYRPIRAPGSEE